MVFVLAFFFFSFLVFSCDHFLGFVDLFYLLSVLPPSPSLHPSLRYLPRNLFLSLFYLTTNRDAFLIPLFARFLCRIHLHAFLVQFATTTIVIHAHAAYTTYYYFK